MGESVLDTGRHLCEGGLGNNSVCFEVIEALAEGTRVDISDRFFQLTKTFGAPARSTIFLTAVHLLPIIVIAAAMQPTLGSKLVGKSVKFILYKI